MFDVLDPGGVEHPDGSLVARLVLLAAKAQVYDARYARLDDGLGTFATWKESDVDSAALDRLGVLVEDGVEFGVNHIEALAVENVLTCAIALPRKDVVIAATREAVVAHRHDALVLVDDAGPDLSVGVLGALGREKGQHHKVVLPFDVVGTLHSRAVYASAGLV